MTVGDAGVGGGGLGAEVGMVVVGPVSASASGAAASSSQDSATGMGFVRILGGCASGEMASLSRDDWRADADVEVIVVAGDCCQY